MKRIKAVIFDWGDTIMRDIPEFKGPMVFWPRVEVTDGAEEAIKTVHRDLICCLASNAGDSGAGLMGLALKRANIRQYFQYMFTSKELGAQKPNQDFYKKILTKMGISSRECAAVGNDYEKDIAPASNIGIKTIWLSPGADPAAGVKADYIIKSMHELPLAIEKIQQLQDNH